MRLEKNLTLKQLAEKLNCSHVAVSSWETGKSRPGPLYLHKLNQIFGVNLDYDAAGFDPDLTQTTKPERLPDLESALIELVKNNSILVETNKNLTDKILKLIT